MATSEPVAITQQETCYAVIMRDAPLVDAFGRAVDASDDLASVRAQVAAQPEPARYRIVRVETVRTVTAVEGAPEATSATKTHGRGRT